MIVPLKQEIDSDPVQKSESAFRTIAEAATELNVQPHVLRFWETKFSKIRPTKMRGGRRYYRPEDIEFLKKIRDLLYVKGFTIRGVQKLLRDKESFKNEVAQPVDEKTVLNVAQVMQESLVEKMPLATNENKLAIKKEDIEPILSELESLHSLLKKAIS